MFVHHHVHVCLSRHVNVCERVNQHVRFHEGKCECESQWVRTFLLQVRWDDGTRATSLHFKDFFAHRVFAQQTISLHFLHTQNNICFPFLKIKWFICTKQRDKLYAKIPLNTMDFRSMEHSSKTNWVSLVPKFHLAHRVKITWPLYSSLNKINEILKCKPCQHCSVRGPSTNFTLLVRNAANLFVSLQPNFNGVTRGQLCTCSYQNEHGM